VVGLQLLLIGGFMAPSFSRQFWGRGGSASRDLLERTGITHALLGAMAELLGLYVVLAASGLLPRRLRFDNYKCWMRTALAVWTVAVLSGGLLYQEAYARRAPASPPAQAAAAKPAAVVQVTNFRFDPPEVTVAAGDTVQWVDANGRHQLEADDSSFESPVLTAGAEFRRRFDQPGVYHYFCAFHGSRGGKDMAGTVMVKPAR
jgi:plastocyanin